MKKHFQILEDGINRNFILNDGVPFDTRGGSVPNNSLEVWKKGNFKHIALKPEAKELFEKEKSDDLIELINKSKRVSDIEILASVKPDVKKVQEAAEIRIKQLTNTL